DTKEEILIDTISCDPTADVDRTSRDVRKLARILSNVDRSTFGLLVCDGVIKSSSPASQDEEADTMGSGAQYAYGGLLQLFKFLFAIPSSLRSPKSLRSLLVEGDLNSPLNYRFDIAKQLTNSVLFVHSSQFVHKYIRPETVIV